MPSQEDHVRMNSNRTRRTLGLALLWALVGVVAFIVLADRTESAPRSSAADSVNLEQRQATAVSSRIRRHLGVFRRARRGGDRIGTTAQASRRRARATQTGVSTFGENPGLSRRVRTTREGAVYLVAGRSGVCFESESGVESGCQPLANVVSGNNAQAVVCAPGLPEGSREVYGILPDGVRNVSVEYSDGSLGPLNVRNNTYVLRTSRDQPVPLAISWTDEAGRAHTATSSMPADAEDAECASPADLADLPTYK